MSDFFQNKRIESYTMKYIKRLIQNKCYVIENDYKKIQECVGSIQEENKGQQVLLI